ncbi:hypothetical protein EVAR_35400_1 [Eumeta japonica]|uniref:Uncharacterized protein n=1 Tax=Eumeta variegata TaxID=151549 RepID=A0A4C1XD21_EUMVA|nr:hypothetical protein EVAR_35400_1 [Eumeta japonica]
MSTKFEAFDPCQGVRFTITSGRVYVRTDLYDTPFEIRYSKNLVHVKLVRIKVRPRGKSRRRYRERFQLLGSKCLITAPLPLQTEPQSDTRRICGARANAGPRPKQIRRPSLIYADT